MPPAHIKTQLALIEMVASDMDGTFFNAHHGVSEEVKLAVKELESNTNIRVYPATGRCRSAALRKLAADGVDWSDRGGVFLNGAVAYDCDGKVVYERTLPLEIVDAISAEFLSDMDSVVVMPMSNDDTHAPTHSDISRYVHLVYDDPDPIVHADYESLSAHILNSGISIHMLAMPTKDCRETEQQVISRVKSVLARFGPASEFSVVLPVPRLVMVLPQNTSKGTALAALCESLSVDISKAAAIGDGDNDIGMFQSAGLSVAMGNAKDFVKSHASLVVNRNDHPELPGVAHLIQLILQHQQ